MKFQLEFIESKNPIALRDKEVLVEGDLPIIGYSFYGFGKARDIEEGVRVISTSPVTNIETISATEIVFKTENSTYRLITLGA